MVSLVGVVDASTNSNNYPRKVCHVLMSYELIKMI